MAAAKPRRTQVEAIDDLRAEIRLANQIAVLGMGVNALEHDEGKRATSDLAKKRVAQRNQLRAEVRAALDIEEGS